MENVLLLQSSLDLLKSQASCVFWDNIHKAKNMALEFDDPADFINEYPWNLSLKEIGLEEMRRFNIMFDTRGSFGRAVLAVLLLETYFPGNNVKIIEILKTERAKETLRKLNDKNITDPETRVNLAKQLIDLEDYRIIVVINDKQFDPLSCCVSDLMYPNNKSFDPWAALKFCQIIDMALRTDNLEDRMNSFKVAGLYCPDMMMVKENILITSAFLKEQISDAIRELKRSRPTARLFYKMWIEYGATNIFSDYPGEVFFLLEKEYGHLFEENKKPIEMIGDGLPRIH